MKAVTYQGVKDVVVQEVHDPKIEKPDDVIVKVTSTAICGSDLHLIHGLVPNLPRDFIIGHEAMGIVEEVGPEVNRVKQRDRVVIPFAVACGSCRYCNQDLWSQCDNANPHGEVGAYLGYSETYGGYAGGQAEYLRVPYGNVGPFVVPDDLEDERALFLTDILPTSLWGVDQADVKDGDTVVVLGCGPVGLLTQKFAWLKGAERVIAVDYIDYRLAHAREHNSVEVVDFDRHDDTGAYLKEITGGGADVVIDCVGMDGKMRPLEWIGTALKLQGGSFSALVMASQAVRKGGIVSVVGVYGSRYNAFPLGDFFARNVTLKMGQCPVHAYVEPAMEMVMAEKLDPTDIITHVLPLDEAEHGYEIFDAKRDNCIKVVLKP